MLERLMDEYTDSALPHPSPLLGKERGPEGDGWGDRSSSPLYKGGLRGVVQGFALFLAQSLWDECADSELPHPNPLLGKERGQEEDGSGDRFSSSPLYKGGLRGVVQGFALFLAQSLWDECADSELPHPNPLLGKERGQEEDGSGDRFSSSPLYKGGLRGVVQGFALFLAQSLWDECADSELPHPNPLLGKERGQEGRWAISQPWEELLQYCTEGTE
jgi:hypothetical protein